MMFISCLFFIFIQYLLLNKSDALELKAVALTYGGDSQYPLVVKEFNDYAKRNSLDIELKIIIYTPENSSIFVNDFGTTIEFLLTKKPGKYDIFFYDNMYSPRYSSHFVDLKDLLPEEHFDLYSTSWVSEVCKYKDKWVGLPLSLDYNVIFAKIELLNEYNKDYPHTWDELINIGKEILEKEKEKGNDIIAYNGLFPDDEAAFCSIHEFIYSFRETKDSPFPGYSSKEAVNALNKIKEIKEKISSDEIFKGNSLTSILNIFGGNGLFIKFWYTPDIESTYKMLPLMGNKKGVSGSSMGGSNIAISKYITQKKIEASAKVIEFMTSEEVQKNIVIGVQKRISGIYRLYDDDEVCKNIDCELIKSIQPIPRPSSLTNDYDDYSLHYRKYFEEFLYGNKSALEILTEIDDIVKIHYMTIDPSDSPEGFIVFIVAIILMILMISSSVFLFIKKYKVHFNFLDLQFWIIMIIGLSLNLSTIFCHYGMLTEFKCEMRYILMSIGYSLLFVPIIQKLIINFPENNSISYYVKDNRILTFTVFITFDIIINSLLFISSFEPHENIINNGKNFMTCGLTTYGLVISGIVITVKVIISLIGILLLFIEWNLARTSRDIKLITSAVYSDILLTLVFVAGYFLKIQSYSLYFILNSTINLMYVFSNYLFLYGLKVLTIIIKPEQPKLKYIEKANTVNSSDFSKSNKYKSKSNKLSHASSSKKNSNNNLDNRISILTSKILSYHFYSGEESKDNGDLSTPNSGIISFN